MSSASLTTSPSNASSSRSSLIAAGLTVAGSGPSERTTTCAVITALTPASTAARNGSSSGASTTGSSWCESCRVSPWPGKCLAQAATPARCVPRTNAATWRATTSGTEPKARIPITGLSGFVFTSATGARFRFTPTAASSAAIAAATASVSSTSSTTPRPSALGNELPCSTSSRVTSPPSSSSATSNRGASSRSAAVNAASCSGSWTFVAKRQTPPSPSASHGRSHSGRSGPAKLGTRQAAASRESEVLTRGRRRR